MNYNFDCRDMILSIIFPSSEKNVSIDKGLILSNLTNFNILNNQVHKKNKCNLVKFDNSVDDRRSMQDKVTLVGFFSC